MDKILTIAIPTYNRKSFLKRALDSILCQNDDSVEILVSDNASNDGTQEMMQSEYPQARYFRNNENIGAEANFLKCYELASGKFVLLLGSDDLLTSGSLKRIIYFLNDNSECKVVFLNHGFFKGEYINLDSCYKFWNDDNNDLATPDKEKVINFIGRQITYMSCMIINRSAYYNVSNPEQYIWTSFLHSNIMLECCKQKNDIIGIIGYPCIADNLTYGDAGMHSCPEKSFEVFGKGMEYTLCKHAVECGFNRKSVRSCYMKSELFKWPGLIVYLKSINNAEWYKQFKMYGYQILEKISEQQRC